MREIAQQLYLYTAFLKRDFMKTRSPFLNAIADHMLSRHYSLSTVETYSKWISAYIHFYETRHPAPMGKNEVTTYLDHLRLKGNVPLELKQLH